MAASNNSSVSSKLLDAIKNDDMEACQSLISANPKVFDLAVWPENPLILACKLRRFAFILVIGNIKPELALQKIQHGTTVLHLSCIYGDDEMVRALLDLRVNIDRPLCYEKDDDFLMIPLQFAVVHGRVDVILLLLSAFPDSITELNSEKQTVFHLATEYCVPDAFRVLVGEAKKLNREYLLDEEDCHGNTVLHIAIVKMCLPDQLSSTTSGHDFPIRVNTKNMSDETALDLCDKIPDPDHETRQIESTLREAIRREVSLSNDPGVHHRHPKRGSSTSTTIPSWRTLETKNVLLVVLAIFITLAFTLTCSLPTFFPKEYMLAIDLEFELKDLLYAKLPLIFYIMSFTTVLLTTSTCILSVLLYSLPCGTLMLLGGFVTFILYLLLAYFVMPKFSVRVGSQRHLPSYYLMLILALGVIFVGSLLIHLGDCLILCCNNYAKSVINKVVSKFWSRSNKRLPISNPPFQVQMVGNALLANTNPYGGECAITMCFALACGSQFSGFCLFRL
ncbi:hypothetical protein EZV62_005501 [Acer yangbiense]|uniref:Uncharacterized protein n=1 Tax=Acer yangbiense TaxID=1000413 RepID=A0A5C7IPZ4_9ROSI|nr:hypothetical protein EZV62_005501 [Acer yangbiense]